jgi:curved DNA-binding protein CbpA
MVSTADPHRTLGVAPGASLNEIRSAYRRLVKQYHPDAAGERALPRFLAIQAAYERLVDGEGRLRTARRAAGGSTARRPEGGRTETGRAGSSGPAGFGPARSGSGGPGPARPGAAGPGPAGPGPARPSAGERRHDQGEGPAAPGSASHAHRHRAPRKATPGSTTYDEAAETPLDPPWDGGAWYGPTSGTFWTLNPREYADPRKHGPEYEARARRATRRDDDEDAGPGP